MVLPPNQSVLGVQEGLERIRRVAAARRLIFKKAASNRLLSLGIDQEDVAEMLSEVDASDMHDSVEEAEHFEGCDMYTFLIDDEAGDRWYSHVAVHRTKNEVVIIASWKLDGSPA